MSPERKQYQISFEEIISNAKETTLKDGHHVPILIVEGSKNLIVSQLQEMPETHNERLALMKFIGVMAAKSEKVGNLEQVFLVSEGWMSIASENKPPEMRPSKNPNRKEVLIVSGLHVSKQEKQLKIFEMIRNPNKQVVDLPELHPSAEKEGKIEIPLLEAFAEGFKIAYKMRAN